MNLFHMSDVHVDHLSKAGRDEFLDNVSEVCSDPTSVALLTGDITVGPRLEEDITALSRARACSGRLLYVLGNHDVWGSSFASVETLTRALNVSLGPKTLCLDHVDEVRIAADTAVVGDSGWYDARNGGPAAFALNDWYRIAEYIPNLHNVERFSASVADARANRLRRKLDALARPGSDVKKIVVLTHVPPFPEACRHRGRPTDDSCLKWYSSRATGDVLDGFCADNPDIVVEVLCGHTHGGCRHARHGSLAVTVAEAEYGSPAIRPWTPTTFEL